MVSTDVIDAPFLSILRKASADRPPVLIDDFLSSEHQHILEEHGSGPNGPVDILFSENEEHDRAIMLESKTGQELYDYHLLCQKLDNW